MRECTGKLSKFYQTRLFFNQFVIEKGSKMVPNLICVWIWRGHPDIWLYGFRRAQKNKTRSSALRHNIWGRKWERGLGFITQMAFLLHHSCPRPHWVYFHKDVLSLFRSNVFLSPQCSFFPKAPQTAGKLRKCETNKVKWSQEIMQRGTISMCEPAWKWAAWFH